MTTGGPEFPASDRDGAEPDFDPAEAFSLLGDETRLRILFALHDPATETPLEFSKLYEYIDTQFTSGFNYHLDKLIPEFVTKTDDGYALNSFGRRVARTVAAGTFTGHREIDWFPIDGLCVVCGESALEATFGNEMFVVDCQDCDERILQLQPPPNLVNGCDAGELVEAVDHWMHNWMQMTVGLARHGICDYCGGAIESSVVDDIRAYDRLKVLLRFECRDCGEIRRSAVGALASKHPAVEKFMLRHDAHLRDQRYWEVEQWITDEHMEIVSTDPWEFRVSFHAGGERCIVTVSGEPAVVDVSY